MPNHPKPSDVFQPGQVLAERFQVRHLIARGGMGEVYEVEDLTLHEQLALKTIYPEFAQDEWTMDRFMQEVHLARQVTHPNVCRMFDVFQHRFEDGKETTFVTMELLEGETLTDFLDARGRMEPQEAMPLVRQLAAGLDAAHRAGVIHRDFKSDNVTLVPSEDAEGGLRAVITDFGLASAMAAGGAADRLLEEEGLVMGTPAYMAPEQLLDGDITAATDLYALGAVVFEMVTGKLPFPDSRTTSEINDGSATGIRSLGSEPPSPREHVPELDARWEQAIMRMLKRRPEDRFASGREMEAALLGIPLENLTRTDLPVLRPGFSARTRMALALAAFLFVVLIVVLLRDAERDKESRQEGASPVQAIERPSVAVLGLDNLSGRVDDDWYGTALAEMLKTELAADGGLRVVSGETVTRARLELGLDDTETNLLDGITMDNLSRLRALLGADHAVLGTYLLTAPEAGELRLDLRILDTSDGDLLGVSQSGPREDLFDIVVLLGADLRGALGVAEPASGSESAANVRAAVPEDPEAARLYAEGLDSLRRFDALEARDRLQESIELDATAPLTHAALARAWEALGFEARAGESARRAEELSEGLSREQALFLRAYAFEAARDWPEAISKYSSLRDFYPDDLDYGLRLAAAQRKGGDGRAALLTLEELRGLEAPASLDPRIELSSAEAFEALSAYPESRAAARTAAERGRELGAQWITAQALFLEGRADWRLGELDEARRVTEQAGEIFADVGDRAGLAGALNLLGNAANDQNRWGDAREFYTEALKIMEQIGNTSGAARALSNLGNTENHVGAYQEALGRYEESLAMSREINDLRSIARGLNNVATALEALGDLDGARDRYVEALGIVEEIGFRLGVGLLNENLAGILVQQGKTEEARRHFEIAEDVQREVESARHLATTLLRYGKFLTSTGEGEEAEKRLTEARALSFELGASDEVAQTDTALSVLAFTQGRSDEAEASARRALTVLEGGERRDDEAEARAALADALRGLGRFEEARREVDRAAELAGESQSDAVRDRVREARQALDDAEASAP